MKFYVFICKNKIFCIVTIFVTLVTISVTIDNIIVYSKFTINMKQAVFFKTMVKMYVSFKKALEKRERKKKKKKKEV